MVINMTNINHVIKHINSQFDKISINQKNLNDDLEDIGVDSLTFIEIIVYLEKYYNLEMPENLLIPSKFSSIFSIIKTFEKLKSNSKKKV